jgi:hypothetical protein
MDGGEANGNAEPSGPTRQIRALAVTFWLGLLVSACVLAVLALLSWRRRVQVAELGSVSEQWLIEHRGYDRHYPER